jgi:hypothetical protein
MKKLNNKGFAISSILYSMLILIVTLMFLVLGIMSSRRTTLNKLIKNTQTDINERDISYGEITVEPPVSGTMEFTYTNRSCKAQTLNPGKYLLEVWGAQGGTYNTNLGGKGGYSTGILTITTETIVYVCVGSQPAYNAVTTAGYVFEGGFNGGGTGVVHRNGTAANFSVGLGGGGATDIRIGANNFNSRVIVAGGGSGAVANLGNSSAKNGNYGGGAAGAPTTTYGGTQTTGGTSNTTGVIKGTFGSGANAVNANQRYGGSGGGGGWFGGSSSSSTTSSTSTQYHGGGSGYVFASGSTVLSGYLLGNQYKLDDANSLAGNSTTMPTPEGGTQTGNSGNGFARISPITEFAYTGSCETRSLTAGRYKLEVWGAQGGTYSTSYLGGKGGYSSGILTLNATTNVYVCVGEQPTYSSYPTTAGYIYNGGFNGGGNGIVHRNGTNTYFTVALGGGGATDIRIGSNNVNTRVIVAGGGSGSVANLGTSTARTGNYGGGTAGNPSGTYGGTQTTGGTSNSSGVIKGLFGYGANAVNANQRYGGPGGGGGWFGGSSSSSTTSSTSTQYHGGGSGYVFTSTSAKPSGYTLGNQYNLSDTRILAGNSATMPAPTGGTQTGNTGNGFAKITKLK